MGRLGLPSVDSFCTFGGKSQCTGIYAIPISNAICYLDGLLLLLVSELESDVMGTSALIGGGFRFFGMAPRDLLDGGLVVESLEDVFDNVEDDLSSSALELLDDEELLLKN